MSAPTRWPHPVVGGSFASPVTPGSGWPEDLATPRTGIAAGASDVTSLAKSSADLDCLAARTSVCRACPRLVEWRESVARRKRREFSEQPYWGRPVPGWGDEEPEILIVGLAPAANGGNRTGRVFTGDPSGDFLFPALHRAGLAAQPASTAAGDGQRLFGARVLAAVRCAPPGNRPTVSERDTCTPWFRRELELVVSHVRVVVALGGFAWNETLRTLRAMGFDIPRPRPRFGHMAETSAVSSMQDLRVLASYHPSQRNTFTHTLTPEMFDAVFSRARAIARADV